MVINIISIECKMRKMGRIIKKIKIKSEPKSEIEKDVFAVFDTGAERSYVKSSLLPDDIKCTAIFPLTSDLGGKKHELDRVCNINAEIEGAFFNFSAYPITEIGKIDGSDIGVLIGATAMEEWDIKLIPKGKELDLEGLKRREFIEF
ncbi:MAG: hypothetical protein ACTSQJ_19870 [Promethearchaeota archaeon]